MNNVKMNTVAQSEIKNEFVDKASIAPKNTGKLKDEAIKKRLNEMLEIREKYIKHVDRLHVKLQKGNKKTGKNVYTVSLIPIVDCPNCSKCSKFCYDIKHDCIYKGVLNDRAKNSAIHKANPKRYWNEVGMQIALNNVEILRINVGGDLTYEDFSYVNNLAAMFPNVAFQFFTKNYEGINRWLDENEELESNVQALISVWEGMPYSNPYRIPESHLLWSDGRTTAPDYGVYFCKGNCSNCKSIGKGCFGLKKGECVVLSAH